nr:MAG TPA: hypothetical protein [Caudoviricetes sp.]
MLRYKITGKENAHLPFLINFVVCSSSVISLPMT